MLTQSEEQTLLRDYDWEQIHKQFSAFHSYSYDAVMAAGIAACDTGGEYAGSDVYGSILGLEFQGASGYNKLDNQTGTRDPKNLNFGLFNIRINHEKSNNEVLRVETHASWIVDFQGKENVKVLNDFIFADGSEQIPHFLPPKEEADLNLIPKSILALALSLAGVAMLMSIGWMYFVEHYKDRPSVRSSQPFFLHMNCIGCFLMAFSVVFRAFQEPLPSHILDFACMADYWFVSVGFITAFSSILCKTLRLNRLFRKAKTFRKIKVKPRDVVYPFFILLGLNVIILTVWSTVSPLRRKRIPIENYDRFGRKINNSFGICMSDNEKLGSSMLWLFYGVNFLAVVFANYQSYLARGIPTEFNESKYMAMCMALLLEASILGFPVGLLSRKNPTANFLINAMMTFVFCIAVMLPTFLPKWRQRGVRKGRGMRQSAKVAVSNAPSEPLIDTIRRLIIPLNDETEAHSDVIDGNSGRTYRNVARRPGSLVEMDSLILSRNRIES